MTRIWLAVGTRPQIIKSVPIITRALAEHIDLDIIHTGQHYDNLLSDVFFQRFKIPRPSHNLGVGSGSQSYQVGEIIVRLGRLLSREKPDAMIVPGDTNSALAAAVSAVKAGVKVDHVEAGARCYDMTMQEEVNRRLIDHISASLCAVSKNCEENLRKEKVTGRVHMTGDTMFEVFSQTTPEIEADKIRSELGLSRRGYLALTLHRQENTETIDFLREVVKAASSFSLPIVFPVHPRTRRLIDPEAEWVKKSSLRIIEPLDYFSMMRLVRDSELLLTDSGGLQKEAFWSGVPCVTLRKRTEWVETLAIGCNFLVPRAKDLTKAIRRTINDSDLIRAKCRASRNPFTVANRPASGLVIRSALSMIRQGGTPPLQWRPRSRQSV